MGGSARRGLNGSHRQSEWSNGGVHGTPVAVAARPVPTQEQQALDALQQEVQALQARLMREQNALGGAASALQVSPALFSSMQWEHMLKLQFH